MKQGSTSIAAGGNKNAKAELREERGKGAGKKDHAFDDSEGSDSQNEEDIVIITFNNSPYNVSSNRTKNTKKSSCKRSNKRY